MRRVILGVVLGAALFSIVGLFASLLLVERLQHALPRLAGYVGRIVGVEPAEAPGKGPRNARDPGPPMPRPLRASPCGYSGDLP